MTRYTNINVLLAFITVAREGSVSRAAEVLNLTQPAVSQQLKRLAQDTGTALFNRTSSGLELTDVGASLLSKAEDVLNAMDDFHHSARQCRGKISGTLRIGTIVDPDFIRLGPLLRRLRAAHPDIITDLSHAVSGDVLTRLTRGQIDAGFFLAAPDAVLLQSGDDAVHMIPLAEFTYRVIAPPGWQARVGYADWPTLAALPWIGTPSTSSHHGLLAEVFARHGCTQTVVAKVDQEASMLEMVRAGVGLSLCRDSIALHERQTTGLAVSDVAFVPARLGFLTLERHLDRPALRALLDALGQTWTPA
ncbi:LysR family transcriptional regulator [Antarctobacter heliothermus]|uniref:DNA-binding transcriptional regulator, LysR family n=1 Tax=Antarctobacter heliothermus TaxID=74033 RepID=A0A239ECL7_9RHOB|nr:LysR family transcriptional regulator [Antarctobacter heliothermus]SNS41763.1 DNA-binding transcriptional regulator, LysR family [Antarctobacter heliothermus]